MDISVLLGQTLIEVVVEDELVTFETTIGNKYRMKHDQNCCEDVHVEDVIGDITDLVGSPILMAESVSEENEAATDIGTWTFYKLATLKGYVTIRWYGKSNGYYSVEVDFQEYK